MIPSRFGDDHFGAQTAEAFPEFLVLEAHCHGAVGDVTGHVTRLVRVVGQWEQRSDNGGGGVNECQCRQVGRVGDAASEVRLIDGRY